MKMKRIICLINTIAIMLLMIIVSGCSAVENGFSGQRGNGSGAQAEAVLTPTEVYNAVKDCDFWVYSYNGTVSAVKDGNYLSINGEKQICDMQFCDGWIYYVKSNDKNSINFDVFRAKPDGSDESAILNSRELNDDMDGSFMDFLVTERFIYIRKTYRLYRINLGNGEITKIFDTVNSYTVHNDVVYFDMIFADEFTVCYEDPSETKYTIVLKNPEYSYDECYNKRGKIVFADNVLFFSKKIINNGTVDLCKFMDNEYTIIEAGSVYEDSLFEHNGKLYYVIHENDIDHLIAYDVESGEKVKVLSFNDYCYEGEISNGYYCYLDSNKKIKAVMINAT